MNKYMTPCKLKECFIAIGHKDYVLKTSTIINEDNINVKDMFAKVDKSYGIANHGEEVLAVPDISEIIKKAGVGVIACRILVATFSNNYGDKVALVYTYSPHTGEKITVDVISNFNKTFNRCLDYTSLPIKPLHEIACADMFFGTLCGVVAYAAGHNMMAEDLKVGLIEVLNLLYENEASNYYTMT